MAASMHNPPVCFPTPGLHGYSVEFSPYYGSDLLACSCCEQYGIAGKGTLLILAARSDGSLIQPRLNPVVVKSFSWPDGLFDVTWSENNDHIAVTCSGDGSIQVWDLEKSQTPVLVWRGHTKEVYSVDWCVTRDMDSVLSASWDRTIKMWDLAHGTECLGTFVGHEQLVYSVVWSPIVSKCFMTASGDGTVRLWDVRKQYLPQIVLAGSNSEVLTCDWSKYNQNLVASGSTNGLIHLWDLRNPRQFVQQLNGHQYAVRRLKFSPFDANTLMSCSYDFTVRTWNAANQPAPLLETIQHHTEFVYGIDFNNHTPGQVVDCSWDESVKLYSPLSLQTSMPQPPTNFQS